MEPHVLTCISCKLTFASSDEHRAHHRSDLHRFNLQKKVADQPPITLQEYEDYMAKKAAEDEVEEMKRKKKEHIRVFCDSCHRSFVSDKALEQHMRTKHAQVVTVDVPDDDIEVTLTLNDCLFCRHRSRTLPKNIAHMTREHSFFIPEVEYLIDLPGFLRYLAAKLELGNICLWCNGQGKSFASLEGVRGHMCDMSHCKIAYEGNEDEFDAFYDFSTSYDVEGTDADDEKWEDMSWSEEMEEEELVGTKGATVTATGELLLPDGRIVGYREYARAYKQRYRGESHAAKLTRGLQSEYLALGWRQPGNTLSTTTGAIRLQQGHGKKHVNWAGQHKWQKWALSVGRSANKLQKHFREAL